MPGIVPSGEPDQRLQELALSGQPYGNGMESMAMLHVALTAPRQGSGVHTHRQVIARPVCRGIIMCAAINAVPRQPEPVLLLQFAGPSLRRAVTAP